MPDVILPVLNEAAAIPGVLSAMPAGYRAIVVDNNSTDDSADIARSSGATAHIDALIDSVFRGVERRAARR